MTFDTDNTFFRKSRTGNAYIVSESFDIASGDTSNIHLENPTGSDKELVIVEISISSDGPFTSAINDGFSSRPSGGSTVEIQNVLLDSAQSDDDGIAVANKNVTFTSTSKHAAGAGGGSTGNVAIGGASRHPPVLIDEDREIVVEVTNTDSSTSTYVISLLYYETSMNGT